MDSRGEPTTLRVLRLLDLLQRRTVWTGPELADELGVTGRSVRRDVDRLRELGYPVEAERGAGGGYRLGAGRRLPPLLLDDREAVAVAIALRTAAGGAVADVGEPALRALTKLDQVMPGRLREQVAAVAESTSIVGTHASVDAELLVELGHAIRGTERVRLDYRDRHGADTERRAEPYRTVVLGSRWYLLAYDLDREDWRTFRLDRIRGATRTGWRFTPRPEVPDPVDHVSRSVAVSQYPHAVTVTVQESASQVADSFPPQLATVTALRADDDPDGPACVVETGADDPGVLAWYLSSLRAPYAVEGDPAVLERLRALGARALAAAERPTP